MPRRSGYSSPLLSILIVDGSHDLLDDDRLLLEQEGFDVCYVRGGREALAILSRISEPNIILLDNQLHDMSAKEFLNHLGQKFPEIIECVPIVLLPTEKEDSGSIVDGSRKRPINIDKLLSEVHSFIEKRYVTSPTN